MIRLINVITVILLLSSITLAQFNITSVVPSFYFTSGDFSNKISSVSYAGYVSLEFNNSDYFNAGLDLLKIDYPSAEYNQTALYLGWVKNLNAFRFKLNYAQIDGTYDDNLVAYKYSDYLKIYNLGFAYDISPFNIGAAFSYMNMMGYPSFKCRQYELSATWRATDYILISITPAYENLSDSRNLYSLGGNIAYSPTKKLTLQANGFIGERAYYFNSNSLSVNNRKETQKFLTELKADYLITETIALGASVQNTKFYNYRVMYITGGVKMFL